jgi:hypothetical protein
MHTHQVNRLTGGQAEKLERLKRTCDFSSSSVRHNNAIAR